MESISISLVILHPVSHFFNVRVLVYLALLLCLSIIGFKRIDSRTERRECRNHDAALKRKKIELFKNVKSVKQTNFNLS